MWLFLLFVVLPIAEIFVIIEVGQAIGAPWTIGLIIGSSLFGFWLAKREGIGVWRRFQEQTRSGRVPTAEVVDGVLILAGGVFMFLPGFITGFFGLLLLIPPTRAIPRRIMAKRTGLHYIGTAKSPSTASTSRVWVENTADHRDAPRPGIVADPDAPPRGAGREQPPSAPPASPRS